LGASLAVALSPRDVAKLSTLLAMHASKKTVYVETTIPSYATAKQSKDILSANRQAITKLFWEYEKDKQNELQS
jgi:hypothetical protein